MWNLINIHITNKQYVDGNYNGEDTGIYLITEEFPAEKAIKQVIEEIEVRHNIDHRDYDLMFSFDNTEE